MFNHVCTMRFRGILQRICVLREFIRVNAFSFIKFASQDKVFRKNIDGIKTSGSQSLWSLICVLFRSVIVRVNFQNHWFNLKARNCSLLQLYVSVRLVYNCLILCINKNNVEITGFNVFIQGIYLFYLFTSSLIRIGVEHVGSCFIEES